MTILESLRALSNYPLSSAVLNNVLESAYLDGETTIDAETRRSKEYKLAQARVYIILSTAPDISQGGVSYSLTSEDKKRYMTMAENILTDTDVSDATTGGQNLGYIGEDL